MMLCAALSAVAVVLAVKTLIRAARWRRCRGGGPGQHRALRWLFRVLDTTPGQEKVIRAALEEAWITTREARHDATSRRTDLARVFRSETVDDEALRAAQGGVRSAYDRVEEAVTKALRRIHEALDPMQRERLARIVEGGGRPRFLGGSGGGFGGGPYRGGSVAL